MTSRSYFGKMNSTLGSVVPLAMFFRDAFPESADGGNSKRLYDFTQLQSSTSTPNPSSDTRDPALERDYSVFT